MTEFSGKFHFSAVTCYKFVFYLVSIVEVGINIQADLERFLDTLARLNGFSFAIFPLHNSVWMATVLGSGLQVYEGQGFAFFKGRLDLYKFLVLVL